MKDQEYIFFSIELKQLKLFGKKVLNCIQFTSGLLEFIEIAFK